MHRRKEADESRVGSLGLYRRRKRERERVCIGSLGLQRVDEEVGRIKDEGKERHNLIEQEGETADRPFLHMKMMHGERARVLVCVCVLLSCIGVLEACWCTQTTKSVLFQFLILNEYPPQTVSRITHTFGLALLTHVLYGRSIDGGVTCRRGLRWRGWGAEPGTGNYRQACLWNARVSACVRAFHPST